MPSKRDTVHKVYEKLGTLAEVYKHNVKTPSDINEHLPILKSLAKKCDHITEFGTRWCCSTSALLAASPKKLVCYDVSKHPSIDLLAEMAGDTEFIFHKANTREITIEETDLLFIDTWHAYEQLKIELDRHGNKAKKYIAMHDTATYGKRGDTLGGKYPNAKGLIPAINEFVEENSHWRKWKHFQNNNGLSILKRIDQ